VQERKKEPLMKLDETHRIAVRADIPAIARIANADPSAVMVKDHYRGEVYPLSSWAEGPFRVDIQEGVFVLHGSDVKSKEPAQLRIRSDQVVEIKRASVPVWVPASMEGVRLHIPK
jgi:hypothetical protein